MHKFIYPSKDTYINNSSEYVDKNFGNDEILEIYASNQGKKTVFTDINWLPVPETSQSYGYEGALAYSESAVYIYSGSLWRSFSISSDILENVSVISNFTGRLSNVTQSIEKPLEISGSSQSATGSFSGSFSFTSENQEVSGTWTSGSFSGSLFVGSSFDKLIVNSVSFTTSPLTSSLTGTGSFINFTGKISGQSNSNGNTTLIDQGTYCESVQSADLGSFVGEFTSSNFNGYLKTGISSEQLYYADVTEYQGTFVGKYSGTFRRPSTSDQLIEPEFSRTLLYFDISDLSSSIASNEISSSNLKFTLNLKACGARNLPLDYKIYAYPVSQSWQNGDGTFIQDGSNLGVNWYYTDFNEGNIWYPTSSNKTYEIEDYLLDETKATSSWESGGGTWFYSVPDTYNDVDTWICNSSEFQSLESSILICSQSFSNGSQSDIEMDITQIVRSWICGCIPNNGLILLTSFELSTPPFNNTNGLLQFFSRETNTIYSPYLDVAWDDSVFETGSLEPMVGSTENLINIRGLKEEYKHGSKTKIYVFSREKYQLKQFNKSTQQPNMVTPKYLPTSSYYMIKDAESEEVLIDHDEFSKLSCDPTNGNFFVLDTSGLPQERYYKILIKSIYSDKTIDIQDTQKIFKVTR